jgi:hypothetical protein
LALMLSAAGAAYWLLTSEQFELDQVEVSADVRYADVDGMLATLGVAVGMHPNVFEVRAESMRRTLLDQPGIAEAEVRAVLPNRVIVSLVERDPVVIVRRPDAIYAVDAAGVVLAAIEEDDATALGLPTVDDRRREWATEVAVGTPLDPTDRVAMLQLAALSAADIGSSETTLSLSIDDDSGFMMTADPPGWRAIFGHYTPTLRPPEMVPRQVQCLRSLLGQGETRLNTVYLAPEDERCGTFLPSPGPAPRESASPDPPA